MIKVVAFDLGGVFFTEGKANAIKRLVNKYGYDGGFILKLLKSLKSMEFRAGKISAEEFWAWVQKELPEGQDAELVKKEWYDGYVIDNDIKELVEDLKGKRKLIIFSGNTKDRVGYLDKKYDFRKLFDQEVFSYDCGFNKGETEFVEVMIKASGVKAGEIMYVEDDEKSINAAIPFGVHTALYVRGNIKKLREYFRRQNIID